jgi:hypothetical protein
MKYKFIFLVFINKKPVVIGNLLKRKVENKLAFRQKTFIVDIEKPSSQYDTTLLYYIDFENGKQLFFEKDIEKTPSRALIDTVVNQNVISSIVKNIGQDKMQLLFFAIIGGVLGALISGLIAVVHYTNEIQALLSEVPTEEVILI